MLRFFVCAIFMCGKIIVSCRRATIAMETDNVQGIAVVSIQTGCLTTSYPGVIFSFADISFGLCNVYERVIALACIPGFVTIATRKFLPGFLSGNQPGLGCL